VGRRDDLGTISPYITSKTRRFGDWVVNWEPPDDDQVAHLNLPEEQEDGEDLAAA
jgi:hypothetical protein